MTLLSSDAPFSGGAPVTRVQLSRLRASGQACLDILVAAALCGAMALSRARPSVDVA